MTHIERSIDIEAAPDQVFAELEHWDGLPRWSTITVSHRGAARCTHVGEEFDQQIRIAGIPMNTHWRVSEYDPPSVIAYDVSGPGDSWMRMTQRVTSAAAGSRVELEVDYELPAGALGAALDRMYVERRNEREAEHTLHNLKEILEQKGGAEAAEGTRGDPG